MTARLAVTDGNATEACMALLSAGETQHVPV